MTSIRDVAALAGVSIKTVSRVVNKAPGVSEELRQRVDAAIAQLDYRPNQSARRLAGGRSYMIAFLYNNPVPSYTASIQAGATRRCRELGYHLVVELVPLSGSERYGILEGLVAALRPDGVFLAPPLSDDLEILRWLRELNLPCVRIAGYVDADGMNLPTPDKQAGRMVADHLIGMGHKSIGIVIPPPSHGAALERVEGFREGLAAAGLPIEPALIVQGEFDFQSGIAAGSRLLDLPHPPSAVFATNDEMALGIIAEAHRRGLQLPEELSVIGFDDTPASRTAWPSLTTVRQPLENMGEAIIDMLANRIEDAPEFTFELVKRDSCGPARRR